MAGRNSVKLFIFIQKTYEGIGIILPQSNHKLSPINYKNWLILFCLGQIFITSTESILFESNSIIDYGMLFYTCVTGAGCTVLYLIALWETKNILIFIENCEGFIEKSEHSSNITLLYSNSHNFKDRRKHFGTFFIL